MLEALDLNASFPRREYKARLPELQSRLHQLQRAAYEARLSTIVLFTGWDAAGKGSTIKKLTGRLEPRAFTLHAIRAARSRHEELPWMARFWWRLPSWGKMAIFHRGWYREVIEGRVEGELDPKAWLRRCRDIRYFERALDQDRYRVVKFFLHISAQEQEARLEKMAADPTLAWRVGERDWERLARYDDYLGATEETLVQSETEHAPWTLVAATNKHHVRMVVFETLIRQVEDLLRAHGEGLPDYEPAEALSAAHDEDLDG